jgi:UDP-glucose 4-epimerase
VPDHVPPKVVWKAADVGQDDLAPVLQGADVVVHLAWLIQPEHTPDVLEQVNVHGSRRVFEAAAAAGAGTLVYASSIGAYSPGPKSPAVDESHPTGGIKSSIYSVQKAKVERILDEVEAAHPHLRVVRLRPALIFQRDAASEIRRYFLGPFVPNVLLRRALLPLVPRAERLVFQAVHADDVAEAYRRVIAERDVRGAFNIAADPVLEPDALARLLGARKIRVPARALRSAVALSWRARLQPTPEGWLDMGLRTPLLDATRARTELGWSPQRDAGETLLELLEGFHDGAGAPTPPLG